MAASLERNPGPGIKCKTYNVLCLGESRRKGNHWKDMKSMHNFQTRREKRRERMEKMQSIPSCLSRKENESAWVTHWFMHLLIQQNFVKLDASHLSLFTFIAECSGNASRPRPAKLRNNSLLVYISLLVYLLIYYVNTIFKSWLIL